jgi:uncharacterized protein
MDLKSPLGRQPIQAYGDGGFRIADRRIDGAMLVLPASAVAWPVAALADVTLESLAPLQREADEVDLLLLGCGRQVAPLPAAVRAGIRGWGVAIEPMDTGAACRTYNVLLAEARRVAAALLPV